MEFLALNVDFSSLSTDPLDSKRPAHAGVKKYSSEKVVIYRLLSCLAWKWLQIGTDMLLIITSTVDELFRNVDIDDFKWPWTPKILILSDILAIFGCKRVKSSEMDGDRPRLPANGNCRRFSRVSWALSQIFVHFLAVFVQLGISQNFLLWQ